MKQQWQLLTEKYLQLTSREQYLILLTGVVAVCFTIFYLFIDVKSLENDKLNKQISQLQSSNKTQAITIKEYQAALRIDPNTVIKSKITRIEDKMAKVDKQLLALTSELIDPIQMRHALLKLLKLEPNVSLLSFELIGAVPLITPQTNQDGETENQSDVIEPLVLEEAGLNLYRHGIKIKLSGSYFDLMAYLQKLEQLSWTFFWQQFDFTLKEYPVNEVEIEIYSLGTKEDFVGV